MARDTEFDEHSSTMIRENRFVKRRVPKDIYIIGLALFAYGVISIISGLIVILILILDK